MPWLTTPFGVALVFTGLFDMAVTVLHAQAESPISNRLNRALWRAITAGAAALPRRGRDRVLAWGLPVMVGSTIAFWAFCSTLGFALLYLPGIHDPAHFARGDAASAVPLADALYFSGVTFVTLGYGDFVPAAASTRLLAVLEGALGLLTISLSVTYLLSVYPAIGRKIALAAALNQETAGRADGVALAARYVSGAGVDALGERLRWLNGELLYLGQAHASYPLLFYARPRVAHESFVRILAMTQGVVATLRYGLDPVTCPDVVRDPRLAILEEGLLETMHGLDRSYHLGTPDDRVDAAPIAADFAALTEGLRSHGLTPVAPDDPTAVEAYARFRAATDPYVSAYAKNLGYAIDEVYGLYSRWARDAALVPGPAEEAA
jgi:voltage-gated potassium channel Kch